MILLYITHSICHSLIAYLIYLYIVKVNNKTRQSIIIKRYIYKLEEFR